MAASAAMAIALLGSHAAWAAEAPSVNTQAKKGAVTCDVGALANYNAYVAARRAVAEAYEAALAKAKAEYQVALQTGSKAQRKAAKSVFDATKFTALANRNLSLQQLGLPPKMPTGCKAKQT